MSGTLKISIWEGSKYGRESKYSIDIEDGDLYYISKFIRAVETIAESLAKIAEEKKK